MKKNQKALILVILVCLVALVFVSLRNYLLNKYSVLPKQERLHNMLVCSGTTEMDRVDYANEIDAALSKYTNWDNLFLSDRFKKKYKNRKHILDDVDDILNVRTGVGHEYGDDVVLVYAEKKSNIFNRDESDSITTEYHFKYILDDAGEIDDLILLEKFDTYTINGEPVETGLVDMDE